MPDISIGGNGNWYINGSDTGIPAKGDPGAEGQSAYQLWVQEVKSGNVFKDGVQWDTNRTSVADFWEFLSGADGKDGEDGEDGDDGVVKGYYNVIAHPYISNTQEYVSWEDGSVTYKVYDKRQQAAAKGTKVKIGSLVNGGADVEFEVDEAGLIKIDKQYLPPVSASNVMARVKSGTTGDWENAYANTYIPARMKVRIVADGLPGILSANDGGIMRPCHEIRFKVQRSRDGGMNWEKYFLYTWHDEFACIRL